MGRRLHVTTTALLFSSCSFAIACTPQPDSISLIFSSSTVKTAVHLKPRHQPGAMSRYFRRPAGWLTRGIKNLIGIIIGRSLPSTRHIALHANLLLYGFETSGETLALLSS